MYIYVCVERGPGPLERKLTGDSEIDDDIRAFYAAREKLRPAQ